MLGGWAGAFPASGQQPSAGVPFGFRSQKPSSENPYPFSITLGHPSRPSSLVQSPQCPHPENGLVNVRTPRAAPEDRMKSHPKPQ